MKESEEKALKLLVNAFNEADAEEKAKQMASDDFDTQINYWVVNEIWLLKNMVL